MTRQQLAKKNPADPSHGTSAVRKGKIPMDPSYAKLVAHEGKIPPDPSHATSVGHEGKIPVDTGHATLGAREGKILRALSPHQQESRGYDPRNNDCHVSLPWWPGPVSYVFST